MSSTTPAVASRKHLGDVLCYMVAKAEWWREKPGEKSLHDFRIALRRCRGLLRALRAEFPARDIQPLRRALARAASLLGEVRDIDVMLELIESCPRGNGRKAALATIEKKLIRQRTAHLHRAEAFFAGPEWPRIQHRIDRLLLLPSKRIIRHGHDTMEELIDHEYHKLARSMKRSLRLARADDLNSLHDFRTVMRRLRYFERLLRDHISKKRRKKIRKLRPCEQQLGLVHDVDVLIVWLDQHARKTPNIIKNDIQRVRMQRLDVFRTRWNERLKTGDW